MKRITATVELEVTIDSGRLTSPNARLNLKESLEQSLNYVVDEVLRGEGVMFYEEGHPILITYLDIEELEEEE